MQAAFEAAGWALDGQVHKEKLYYPAETPLVSALLEVYRDATGDNAPPKCIGGGTYAKMLPNVVAFGPLFAGDPVTEHQPDECIDLERLVQNARSSQTPLSSWQTCRWNKKEDGTMKITQVRLGRISTPLRCRSKRHCAL